MQHHHHHLHHKHNDLNPGQEQPPPTPSLIRKRSARSPSSDEASEPEQDASLDTLKRTKTWGELEELQLSPPARSWTVDVAEIFATPAVDLQNVAGTAGTETSGSRLLNYRPGESFVVLCVVGGLGVHYHALIQTLPTILTISPSLQPLALLPTHLSSIPALTTPLPPMPSLTSTFTPSPSHHLSTQIPTHHAPTNTFLSLGLLHPLGGGHQPLDALILLDQHSRRRLVLPFGWGAGKHVGDRHAAGFVVERLFEVLVRAVAELEEERGA